MGGWVIYSDNYSPRRYPVQYSKLHDNRREGIFCICPLACELGGVLFFFLSTIYFFDPYSWEFVAGTSNLDTDYILSDWGIRGGGGYGICRLLAPPLDRRVVWRGIVIVMNCGETRLRRKQGLG